MARVISYCLLGIVLAGCFSESSKPKHNVLFVSILPLKYFADKIAGDNFHVEVTVPPGAGPETYSPTPKQMILLHEAQAYFSIGYLGFEQVWLAKLKSSNSQLRIFTTANNLDLIAEDHHLDGEPKLLKGVDPHIWSSPKCAKIIAENICSGMIEIDPTNKDQYKNNLVHLLAEINSVDSTVTSLLKHVTSKKFIIFHPALGYFARDYGLEQLAIEFEGKIPSPKHLQRVIDAAKKEHIRFILIQKEFDKENAEIIAKEIDSSIIQIDPLDYNWPEQMIDIARKLSETPQQQ